MKTIESKDLVIGQEYYDIPDTDLENAALLKFVETAHKIDKFELVAGNVFGYSTYEKYIYFPSNSYYFQP